MFDKNFILHLTLIDGIGPATIQRIIELQRSGVQASDLYLFSIADWQQKSGFTIAIAQKLVSGLVNKQNLDKELDLIMTHNIQWVTIEEESYPSLLKEIYLPPAILYWQGAPLNIITKSLSIVGSRKADSYGCQIVNKLIPDLVAAKYTIISGGAHGIDTLAHEATLKHGGRTVAVLGSGLLRPYPFNNKRLFKSIIDYGGSIVSAFPLQMEPLQGNFPARNRIITGLSQGCLVVQAAKKSGALISAHYAMEQGREVFAIPGSIDNELSIGCNTLIQSGAKLVMSSADILEEFGDRIIISEILDKKFSESISENKTIEIVQQKMSPMVMIDPYVHYSEVQKKIITACKVPSGFDEIINSTQLPKELVHSELFDLQLQGVLEQDFTGAWNLFL